MHLHRKLFETAGRAEDAATEIFAECLRHEPLLGAFLRDVVEAPVPETVTVWTQVRNQHGRGVPDLVIESPGRALRVVVENKLGAGLSLNQPGQYIADLDAYAAAFARLVFQCPEVRRASFEREIRSRLASPADAARVKVVTWERTLHAFGAIGALDPVSEYLRAGLQATVGPEIRYVPPDPVSEAEITMLSSPEYANAMVHLSRLMQKVHAYLGENGWSASAIACEAAAPDSLGFYLQGEAHWFGCFWGATAVHGLGPLWLQSGTEEQEAAVRAAGHPTFPGAAFSGWGGFLIPLRSPTAPDLDAQARAIVSEVERLLEILGDGDGDP